MLNEKEIRALKSSKRKKELTKRAETIKAVILRTFPETSPHRHSLIEELNQQILELSACLPELSGIDLREISGDISLARSLDELHVKKQAHLARHPGSRDVREAIRLGEAEWMANTQIEKKKKIEEEEFLQLVAEIRTKGFTKSSEVSNYIVRNRLGSKYSHISGILELEDSESSWTYRGGFPPDIYARLCAELGLKSAGSNARVAGFTSFQEVGDSRQILARSGDEDIPF